MVPPAWQPFHVQHLTAERAAVQRRAATWPQVSTARYFIFLKLSASRGEKPSASL